MTPVAGLLIAILVGLLVRGPRQALVAATPPWLAILLEQTWLLGSGRGNNPSSTISDPGYWVVQGISLALMLGIASGLSLWGLGAPGTTGGSVRQQGPWRSC